MDRNTLLATLKEILEEDRGEKLDAITDEARLREDLGLDSVDLVTLVMQVQDRFHVVLDSDELEKIIRVKDLVDLMLTKLATKSKAA
jgi:acyl carrier protein